MTTLRVVLIYRKHQAGAYSIEELFHAIAGELDKQVDVIEYEVGNRWNTFRDAWRLRKLKADIYHVTGDINYFVNLLPKGRTILTVHDIGNYLFGLSGVKRWLYKWLWLTLPIRNAGAVTCVSTATCSNIIEHLDVDDRRIEVIENCHSAIFKFGAKSSFRECPIILQVGAKSYKNVPRLVEALTGVQCRLVLVGSLDDALREKLAECGVAYESHVGISHEKLYDLYLDCDIVSFVSLGEGFGVPIIEAQAVGRPLITSDLSPMRDVAGDGACLVDPRNVHQIREGIVRIIEDATYRGYLVEEGVRNVARHSPAAIAKQYLDLYLRLVHA